MFFLIVALVLTKVTDGQKVLVVKELHSRLNSAVSAYYYNICLLFLYAGV